jgi:very-short-patch-repair endonuclease
MKKKFPYEALNPLHGSVNYIKELTPVSRKNRNNPTLAEKKIWIELLRKNQTGFRFLRQKPINRFVLDFYCSELDLAIEIDGSSHNKKKNYDLERDKFLKLIGINTIRFTNNEILNDFENVKQKLKLSLVKGRNGKAERD